MAPLAAGRVRKRVGGGGGGLLHTAATPKGRRSLVRFSHATRSLRVKKSTSAHVGSGGERRGQGELRVVVAKASRDPEEVSRSVSVDEEVEDRQGLELSSAPTRNENWFRVVLAFLFPALGGLLFGYDIGGAGM